MKILVHMRDGRTVHLLARRGEFVELVKRRPEQLDGLKPISAMSRRERDGEFAPSRLMLIMSGSVSFIEVPGEGAAG